MVSKEQQFAQNFPDEDLLTEEPVIDDWVDEEAIRTSPQEVEITDWQDEPQQPQPNITRTESALRGTYDTATSGFGDEIQALGGAAVRSAYNPEPQPAPKLEKYTDAFDIDKMGLPAIVQDISDNYDASLADVRARENLAQQQNPISYGTGQAAGLLGQTYKLAGTKAATAIGNAVDRGIVSSATKSGRLANKAAKVGATGLSGAASGGAYGYGSGEGENRSETASEDAILGGVVGGVAPTVIKAVAKPIGAGLEKLATPKILKQATADDVRQLANEAYKRADELGGVFKPQFTDRVLDTIDSARPKTELGKMLGKNHPIVKLSEDIAGKRGKPLSLSEAQEFDELLGDQIDNYVDATTGKVSKEGQKLQDIQYKFRQALEEAPENEVVGGKAGVNALTEGRKLWSTQARLRDIEKIITRANLTNNPATAIKTGFRNLYTNPSRIRGYSEEEKALIKKATETGLVDDLLGIAGSRLNPIIAGASGSLTGATAAQATSMAARGAKTALRVGKAEKVAQKVAGQYNTVAQPTLLNKAAQLLLDKAKNGGRISVKEINDLPPKDAQQLLNEIKLLPPPEKAAFGAPSAEKIANREQVLNAQKFSLDQPIKAETVRGSKAPKINRISDEELKAKIIKENPLAKNDNRLISRLMDKYRKEEEFQERKSLMGAIPSQYKDKFKN